MPEIKCPCEGLVPMTEWIKQPQSEGECRSCALGVVGQWYANELKERGLPDQAQNLERLADNPDLTPVQFCEELDRVKQAVPPEVHERLLDFDCSVQTNLKEGNSG